MKEKKIEKRPSRREAGPRQIWGRRTERKEVAATEAEFQREEVDIHEEEGIELGNEIQVVVHGDVGVE